MKKKSGFTIIEVVLVLAIAGLIFLMVFIALPALQRSQRDTQRSDDLARAQTAITNFQKTNRGRVPCFMGTDTGCSDAQSWGRCDPDDPKGFCARYLLVDGEDTFEDPDGTPYVFKNGGSLKSSDQPGSTPDRFEDAEHQIYVFTNATCDGETAVHSSGTRKVALLYKLEGGGTTCVNN